MSCGDEYSQNSADGWHVSKHRASGRGQPRRWIGVHFECCHVYHRIYRNTSGTAYIGRCPRCYRQLRVRIAPDGVDGRFFRAE